MGVLLTLLVGQDVSGMPSNVVNRLVGFEQGNGTIDMV
jgi:hypothetical protein